MMLPGNHSTPQRPKIEKVESLKISMRKYLKSKGFKGRLNQIVNRTRENGREHAFDICFYWPRGRRLPTLKHGPPLEGTPTGIKYDEFSDGRGFDENILFFGNLESKTDSEILPMATFHTHPYNVVLRSMEGTVISPHMFHYATKEVAFVPSVGDVEALCGRESLGGESLTKDQMGFVVPVNVHTGEFGIIVFKPRTELSYVAYEGLFGEGLRAGPEILQAAVERSILNVAILGERSCPILSEKEIDQILRMVELK